MKKRFTLSIFLLFLILSICQAQRYGTAIGLRFGNNNPGRMIGITAQQRIIKQLTLEGILQSDFNLNSSLSLLLEKHHPIISKRFNYYYGAGLSVGKEESFVKDPEKKLILHTYNNGTVGVDFLAGLELTILNTAISLDYKPNINLVGREEFYRGQIGISARMVLVKSKEQKKNQRQRQRKRKQNNSNPSFTDKVKGIFQR